MTSEDTAQDNSYIKWIPIIISIVSVLIALKACTVSNEANDLSLDSNEIARQANDIASNVNRFQMSFQSLSIVRQAYDTIYSDSLNRLVIEKLAGGEEIVDKFNLLRIVDIFEDMGDLFCSGNIYRVNLRTQLSSTIKFACNSSQIYAEFKEGKNGLAMLCYELFPDSLFASTIDATNIGSCKFIDTDNKLSILINR